MLKHCSSFHAYNVQDQTGCQWELGSSLQTLSGASPGTRGPCRGLERAIPISVIPYLSKRTCPVRLFHLSRTGTGRAEDPDTINLKAEVPMGVRHLANRQGRRPAASSTSSHGSNGEHLFPTGTSTRNRGKAGSPLPIWLQESPLDNHLGPCKTAERHLLRPACPEARCPAATAMYREEETGQVGTSARGLDSCQNRKRALHFHPGIQSGSRRNLTDGFEQGRRW